MIFLIKNKLFSQFIFLAGGNAAFMLHFRRMWCVQERTVCSARKERQGGGYFLLCFSTVY